MNAPENVLDVAIVDEAHRLTQKTGLFRMGEDQIWEILRASAFTIFFVDDQQRVHIKDYGSVAMLKERAGEIGAEVDDLAWYTSLRVYVYVICGGVDVQESPALCKALPSACYLVSYPDGFGSDG